jgi:hypothetical protein
LADLRGLDVVNEGRCGHERIATDTEGQAQLLMLDGSSFTIGPGASVMLDEFYFDPASGRGRGGLNGTGRGWRPGPSAPYIVIASESRADQ